MERRGDSAHSLAISTPVRNSNVLYIYVYMHGLLLEVVWKRRERNQDDSLSATSSMETVSKEVGTKQGARKASMLPSAKKGEGGRKNFVEKCDDFFFFLCCIRLEIFLKKEEKKSKTNLQIFHFNASSNRWVSYYTII